MTELKKYYKIVLTETIIRHEARVHNCLFHQLVETDNTIFSKEYNTREEAEKEIKKKINNYKPLYSHYNIQTEKDLENNLLIVKQYTALIRNFYSGYSNTELNRKKEPYFTIYKHYSIVECIKTETEDMRHEDMYYYDKWDRPN